MARFDVYHDSSGYFLDVQADVLEALTTRIAMPLLPPRHRTTRRAALESRVCHRRSAAGDGYTVHVSDVQV